MTDFLHEASKATSPIPGYTQCELTELTRAWGWAAPEVHTQCTPFSHAPLPRKAQNTAQMTHPSRIEGCIPETMSHHLVPDGTPAEQSPDTELNKTNHLLSRQPLQHQRKKTKKNRKRQQTYHSL